MGQFDESAENNSEYTYIQMFMYSVCVSIII